MSAYKLSFLITALLFTQIAFANEVITPLPVNPIYDKKKAAVGKILFFDPILSLDRSTSCNSCHDLAAGGADKKEVSIGIDGLKGNIQSPTVLNARYNFKQFWNGRAETLLEQANGPIHNPKEMGLNSLEVEKRINASHKYKTLFSNYHDGPISYLMILEAIVEFEKALVTPNSKFDRYLRGEIQLTELEYAGYQTFKTLGCITCHNGMNIGGNSFQKMGMIIPYIHKEDYPDLYSLTKKDYHKNVFKVPTLRNIALLAPYFHDASAKTLEEAVKIMSKLNLGYIISEQQIKELVAFLNTLTGETPEILD
ncbi:MAG: c-type cytochrome [gamma proteobacterium symbiont of Bathyaustriella thionipta]|nr:c-type cytochrome [gamma proteobacterium symbiont of Bathyaustriella thionipta]MCU7950037.1 c-type cytochrome [gamma proteobacterium symbiont of Bathyaustriella thionipta]MCU7954279.1 c-type cytochrome [gamma proteobacterium symbiont of Bathyaustriella thionipta]MCU7956626.1 c-type cytochrome [gamma proteobacterium symbiont of Bathyaustriella thionipta]MCU7969019.1 c-type cytochrome [gamma proteobacterium symbiont of Bathyaustriella thionipta]